METFNKYNDEKKIYYLGYKMMELAFENENIYNGLCRALFLAKIFTETSEVILYKKNHNDQYDVLSIDSGSKTHDLSQTTAILNKIKDTVNLNKPLNYNYKVDNSINNIVYFNISINDEDYVLAFHNFSIDKEKKYDAFFSILKKTLQTIIKNVKKHEELCHDVNIDTLTGVNNRNSYEKDIITIDHNANNYIYALFDLFRLKYVNDNYNHYAGDRYIIKTADILKKYFPQYRYVEDINGNISKEDTGIRIYRIGGDEFVLIDQSESEEIITAKINAIQKEVSEIDLEIGEDILLGINYGLACRDAKESIKSVYIRADKELQVSKRDMYVEFGIDRRK